MGKITAIKVQKRNPDRVSVFINGEFRFGLFTALANQIKVGQELSDHQIQEYLDRQEHEVAYRQALRWLSRRPHTIEEIRMKLRRKQAPAEVIDKVIDRLQAAELLDDLSFAEVWVENRQTFRPRGRRALRNELRKKGVANSIIDEVLKDFDDEEAAYQAAERAYPRYRGLTAEIREQRLLAYLARRGFNYSLCRRVVDQTLKDALVSEEESEVEK